MSAITDPAVNPYYGPFDHENLSLIASPKASGLTGVNPRSGDEPDQPGAVKECM